MSPIGLLAIIVLVSIGLVLLRGQPEHMKEKRTYMFEDENGDQYNPFSEVSEGVEDANDKDWKYSTSRFD